MNMYKTCKVVVFSQLGRLIGEDKFFFSSKLSRPRRTFMPDAVNAFKEIIDDPRKHLIQLSKISHLLHDEAKFAVLDERYGYPHLVLLDKKVKSST
jgi:hypothetical protein